jgi:hypothetical protein
MPIASTASIVVNCLTFLCLGTAIVTLLVQAIRYTGPGQYSFFGSVEYESQAVDDMSQSQSLVSLVSCARVPSRLTHRTLIRKIKES